MKGVEVLARALMTAADRLYTVPGYPVSELGSRTRAEMVINEKTALEYALGDSLNGKRAAVIIKNVGVNACADPLLQATAQGAQTDRVFRLGKAAQADIIRLQGSLDNLHQTAHYL